MAAPRPLGQTAARLAGRLLDLLLQPPAGRRRAALPKRRPERRRTSAPGSAPGSSPDVAYRPHEDGNPDPGEVVWAWVPYDEGDGRGKDRPVLVIGRRGGQLLGLMLSSQDHDRDAADEARHGRIWTDVGSGAWDTRGRPSEVRLDRLLVLDPESVRREGAALDRARFERVVGEARRVQGW
ncbi:MAG TPA: type II toxin-antitoxin system PemK/MazF family toxin [Blastococcus sp.]|nr:type II toxin-antitoxin system PemK/MazF family toxin [Blastococcus sp.]